MVICKNFYYIFVGQKNQQIMSKKKDRPTITPDMLSALQTELRELDLKWTELLEKQIREDKSVPQSYIAELSVRKIYNVFHNIVRNTGWKVLIYGQGKTLAEKLQDKIEKVANQ